MDSNDNITALQDKLFKMELQFFEIILKLIQVGAIDLFLRGGMIAGLGLDLDCCLSQSQTKDLERQPVLVTKK